MSKFNPSISFDALSFIGLALIVFSSIVGLATTGWSQVVPSSQQPDVPLDSLTEVESARSRYEQYRMLMEAGAISRVNFLGVERDYCAVLARYRLPYPAHVNASTPLAPRSELEQAEENLRIAEDIYRRTQPLYRDGGVSQNQLQAAQEDCQTALQIRDRLAARDVNRHSVQTRQDEPNVITLTLPVAGIVFDLRARVEGSPAMPTRSTPRRSCDEME